MKKFQVFVFTLIVLSVVAYFTKPADAQCLRQAQAAVRSRIQGDYSGNHAVIDRMLEGVVKKAVRVEDRFLYKSIVYTYGGTTRQIGWGAFGMVNILAE